MSVTQTHLPPLCTYRPPSHAQGHLGLCLRPAVDSPSCRKQLWNWTERRRKATADLGPRQQAAQCCRHREGHAGPSWWPLSARPRGPGAELRKACLQAPQNKRGPRRAGVCVGVSPVLGPHLRPPSRVGSCQNSPVRPRNKKALGVNHIETKQVCQNQSRPLNPPGLRSPCLSRETAPRSGGAAQTARSRSPGPLPLGSL